MVLVPANMVRFGFSPYKKNCFWSLQNILVLKLVPEGTKTKTSLICKDQNHILATNLIEKVYHLGIT